ncbi:hypothetical protein D9757_000806 [Collybiopsis confluens]|uniref:beta-glucosidase n=1 Tax=Collybiopsis confluens TaxID=2823264 RepID=A0A8H5I0A2_9AGAR|nr:hypothetical protein D9757_000806 [Collybiopsis confluens]
MMVVNTVGPGILDTWIDHENVTAVLYGGDYALPRYFHLFADQYYRSGGTAVRQFYRRRPLRSGYTLRPLTLQDESDVSQFAIGHFTEGNLIDYKWFDAHNTTPRYEFGYGLSYTTFSYGKLSAQKSSGLAPGLFTIAHAVGGREDHWDEAATVTLTITNTGAVAGSEIAQYDVADQPIRQLQS